MASLATALKASGSEFSNELTYVPGMAPRSANCAALERGGMQVNILAYAIYLVDKALSLNCVTLHSIVLLAYAIEVEFYEIFVYLHFR